MNLHTTILLEFLLISSSILILFKFRNRLGLVPLYILLGSVQYIQANLGSSFSFIFFGNYEVYPGSIILFSGLLFAVLLIYIKEGVASSRALIVGIIVSNLIMTLMLEITYLQSAISNGINKSSLPLESVFHMNFKYFFIGTIILLIDFFLIAILYQYLISKIKTIPFSFVLLISLLFVLIFDSFAFNLLLFYGTPTFKNSLISHLIGKSIAALIYSSILYLYLKYVDKEKTKSASFITSQDRDVFSIINYKQKYLDLKLKKQKLTHQIDKTLNSISDGFATLDTNWCFTYANIKTGELLRKKPEDIIGKQIWEVFPDNKDLTFSKIYHKAVESKQSQYIEAYYEPLDKWFENRIYPSVDGLTIYFRDITEKKKSDNNTQMLRSLIETSDDFIGLATLKGKLLYVNNNGKSFVGLKANDKLPYSIKDFFPRDYPNVIENEDRSNIFGKGKWSGESHFQNLKTGNLIPIDMSGFIIRDSISKKPMALGIVAKDITQRKKVEEDLKNRELLFRRLSSNAPVAIFQTDKDSSCNYVNEEWEKYASMSFEDAMGYGWYKALHQEDRKRVIKEWKQSIALGNEFKSEFRFQNTKGEVTWLSAKAVGIYDTNNNLYSFIGIALDVTQHKEAEENLINSEKLFRRLTSEAPAAIFQTDVNGYCNYVNEKWIDYAGISFEEAMGYGWSSAIHPDDKERIVTEWELYVAKGDAELETAFRFQHKNKKVTWVTVKTIGTLDSENNLYGYIGMALDITEKKKAENELENHKQNLEELIELRTSELEKEKVKAQSADLMKSAFLATMSHELRTPMNSIIGFTGILLKELAGPLNDEQKKQLSMVKNSGKHLLGLINDILDISKIEAGKLKVSFYPFNYLTYLEKTISFLIPQATAKGLKIKTEISSKNITLESDERRVEQILLNLISNAIKFSKKGTILIKVDVKNEFLITQVIDEGIGISKKNLVKLFMPFIQLEAGLNRNHEGTGLGLSICKSLVEKLGGSITAESELGKGSKFTFKLPLEHSYKN